MFVHLVHFSQFYNIWFLPLDNLTCFTFWAFESFFLNFFQNFHICDFFDFFNFFHFVILTFSTFWHFSQLRFFDFWLFPFFGFCVFFKKKFPFSHFDILFILTFLKNYTFLHFFIFDILTCFQKQKSDIFLTCAKPATLEKFWMQITKLVVIKRGEALNPRVPVVYLGFEYRSVHDGERGFTVKPTTKYVDECLDMVQLQNAKAVMTFFNGTEELESARWDDGVCSNPTFTVQSCCWITAVHNRSETGSDVRDKMLVIQTCITNTCRFDTFQESVEIFERNMWTESPPDNTCIETEWPEQDLETRHGMLWCWLGWWPSDEEKHILHSVSRWSISPDERMSRTGNCCLVQRRTVCVGCTVSWVDFRTSYPERDWTIIPETRESRQ